MLFKVSARHHETTVMLAVSSANFFFDAAVFGFQLIQQLQNVVISMFFGGFT